LVLFGLPKGDLMAYEAMISLSDNQKLGICKGFYPMFHFLGKTKVLLRQ
jgi:hypothetical protein